MKFFAFLNVVDISLKKNSDLRMKRQKEQLSKSNEALSFQFAKWFLLAKKVWARKVFAVFNANVVKNNWLKQIKNYMTIYIFYEVQLACIDLHFV